MRLLPTLTEITKEGVEAYEAMQQSKGWQFHQSVLQLVRGRMLEVLLSKRFTEQSAQEKDVQQRVFHELDCLITFLIDPLSEFRQSNKWKIHNANFDLNKAIKEKFKNG